MGRHAASRPGQCEGGLELQGPHATTDWRSLSPENAGFNTVIAIFAVLLPPRTTLLVLAALRHECWLKLLNLVVALC